MRLTILGTREKGMGPGWEVTGGSDGDEVEGEGNTLTKLLSASTQFNDPQFIQRCQYHNAYSPQRLFDNYVSLEDGTSVAFFQPRNPDLVRCFTCGTTSAFIRVGTDIFK